MKKNFFSNKSKKSSIMKKQFKQKSSNFRLKGHKINLNTVLKE